MLSKLNIKHSYRSDESDIIKEFYIPCLEASNLYRRAVGFFSSSGLSVAAKGIHTFLKGSGRMELVASPHLSLDDIEAITKGYLTREEVEEQAILKALEGEFDIIVQQRLGLLAWLIQYNRLDIKIATVQRDDVYGIYHEKLGIFSDGKNFVAFTGSPNESATGLVNNFECIDVFCSWKDEDKERAYVKWQNFEKLWSNNTKSLKVYSFPEAAQRSLLRFRQSTLPENDPEVEQTPLKESLSLSIPKIPSAIKLREYQEDAINNWFKANGRGTLKMATGSGKTITSLALVAKLYEKIDLQALIVICPYRHLVTQWSNECEKFGLQPIRCFENRYQWLDNLKGKLYNTHQSKSLICAITTNTTFSQSFQDCLPFFPSKTLLIADEVHNLGANNLLKSLPKRIGLRLGLSATPERWFDERGTEELLKYFGGVLAPEFTLKNALDNNALVPYTYHPIFITLTDEEIDEYIYITKQIKKYAHVTNNVDDSNYNSWLSRRARLLGTAHNKLIALKTLMGGRLDTSHTLFYCGDGKVEEPVTNELIRHIDAVCRVLGSELNYRVDSYTAETTIDEREDLKAKLETGELQGLVAIRCLDEGVDIPSIKTAVILASSTNPRQFIQRRGRILRPHPNKQKAEIFDMIVVPPKEIEIDLSVERSILKPELRRYLEFASLALNRGDAMGLISEIQAKYGLHTI